MTTKQDETKTYNVHLEGVGKIRVMADRVDLLTHSADFYKGSELVACVSRGKLIAYQELGSIPPRQHGVVG